MNIGMLGLGKVAEKLVEYLLSSNDKMYKNRFTIKRIAILDINKSRGTFISEEILTTNADDVITNPEVDVVIELIGGLHPAKNFIETALMNSKHVITANRPLISKYGSELLSLAKEMNVRLEFEGAVGCGIPIINSLKYLKCNHFTKIAAILNSTTNYILSEMTLNTLSFEEALKLAVDNKLTEPDVDDDLNAIDSAEKLSILALVSKSINIDFGFIARKTVRGIDKLDIELLTKNGFAVKQIAIMIDDCDGLSLGVSPFGINNSNLLCNVFGRVNAIFLEGDVDGPLMFYGKGVSPQATACSIISDLNGLMIRSNLILDWQQGVRESPKFNLFNYMKLVFYLRFKLLNEKNPDYLIEYLKEIYQFKELLFYEDSTLCIITNRISFEEIQHNSKDVKAFDIAELEVKIPILEPFLYCGVG